jgi:hypothetical protein
VPSMAVPPTCPKQRSTAVTKGQHRSTGEVADLRHRRTASSATVLPKLAVGRAGAAPGAVNDRNAADNHGATVGIVCLSSVALSGRAPQVTVSSRFALTRKRLCASTSRSSGSRRPTILSPVQPCPSAPPRPAPWPRTPGPAWHAPWPGQPATRPGQRWPPPRPGRRPAPGGSDSARGPARRASAAQTCLAQDRPW